MSGTISIDQSEFRKAAFEIVAIATSAGGLNALSKVLGKLPANFPAAIVVVQHLDPRHRSLMADILSRRTPLAVKQATIDEHLQPGNVYIAPPNRHLLVNPDSSLSLTQTELVHFVRPSADLLFDSVAASYKDRAIAVVLTGTGRDGGMGIKAIKKMGGTVIQAQQRLAGLAQQTEQGDVTQDILSQTLDELANALEEVHVLSEELLLKALSRKSTEQQ